MCFFFFSSRRRHTRYIGDWSSDVCSSDLAFLEKPKLLGAEDRVLGSFGHPEFHYALGRNLDGFTSGRVATHSRRAVHQHERSEERRVGKEGRAGWAARTRIDKS